MELGLEFELPKPDDNDGFELLRPDTVAKLEPIVN